MADKDFWTERIREDSSLGVVDRMAEVLFGLIMVLTFTGAISVANSERQEVRELLWAALGCNLAWGIVDAIMYLMNITIDRAHGVAVLKKLSTSNDPAAERDVLKDELPPYLSALMKEGELDDLTKRLKEIPVPKKRILLTFNDLKAGVQIFLLVFLCTLPVAIPFAIITDVFTALRVSNGVALVLLFIAGFRLAKYAHLRPGLTGLIYTLIGFALVSLTMALGG